MQNIMNTKYMHDAKYNARHNAIRNDFYTSSITRSRFRKGFNPPPPEFFSFFFDK